MPSRLQPTPYTYCSLAHLHRPQGTHADVTAAPKSLSQPSALWLPFPLAQLGAPPRSHVALGQLVHEVDLLQALRRVSLHLAAVVVHLVGDEEGGQLGRLVGLLELRGVVLREQLLAGGLPLGVLLHRRRSARAGAWDVGDVHIYLFMCPAVDLSTLSLTTSISQSISTTISSSINILLLPTIYQPCLYTAIHASLV